MGIPVVTVGRTSDDLVGGLERLHGPVSVVRRCGELAELLAACQTGLARAAVVADGSEELTASLVDRLSAVGVAVVALTDNPEETARLRGIGVTAEARAVGGRGARGPDCRAVAQLSGAGARAGGELRLRTIPRRSARQDRARDGAPVVRGARGGPGRAGATGPDHRRLGSGRRARPDPGGRQHRRGAGRGGQIGAAGRRRQLRCQRGRRAGAARRGRRTRPGLPAGGPGPARRRRPCSGSPPRSPPGRIVPGPHRHHPRGPLDRTSRRGTLAGLPAGPGDSRGHGDRRRLLPGSRRRAQLRFDGAAPERRHAAKPGTGRHGLCRRRRRLRWGCRGWSAVWPSWKPPSRRRRPAWS